MGKDPIKHSQTKVHVLGQGSVTGFHNLITTKAGSRSLDGSVQDIQESANTSSIVMISSIIKYITIHFQVAITEEGQSAQNDMQGWLEYGLVWFNEVDVNVPSTNLGTQTLGDIMTKMFRGDCIATGNIPCSVNLPNSRDLVIKLPKKAIKWNIGDTLKLYIHWRSSNSTDLDTNSVKLITSSNFKVYN